MPAVKETRTDTIAPKERSAPVVKKEQPQPIGIRVISLEQFTRLVQEKRTLILDAREPEEYSKGRVPGAINIPYLSVDQYFEKLAGYPRDTLVAIYCNNIMCPLGRGLAEFMVELEFKHLLLFEEGWDRWEREEMPIEH
ncbi:MAG: rhodanese-like domain-containing protein [Bacteroidetes bacterium]|nr:MAG: rhodanese-like domain-containing protein [Bacteroidota bacterium]